MIIIILIIILLVVSGILIITNNIITGNINTLSDIQKYQLFITNTIILLLGATGTTPPSQINNLNNLIFKVYSPEKTSISNYYLTGSTIVTYNSIKPFASNVINYIGFYRGNILYKISADFKSNTKLTYNINNGSTGNTESINIIFNLYDSLGTHYMISDKNNLYSTTDFYNNKSNINFNLLLNNISPGVKFLSGFTVINELQAIVICFIGTDNEVYVYYDTTTNTGSTGNNINRGFTNIKKIDENGININKVGYTGPGVNSGNTGLSDTLFLNISFFGSILRINTSNELIVYSSFMDFKHHLQGFNNVNFTKESKIINDIGFKTINKLDVGGMLYIVTGTDNNVYLLSKL
jgi:hypothetical protein